MYAEVRVICQGNLERKAGMEYTTLLLEELINKLFLRRMMIKEDFLRR